MRQKYAGTIAKVARGNDFYYQYRINYRINEKGKLVPIEENGVLEDFYVATAEHNADASFLDEMRTKVEKAKERGGETGNTITLYNQYDLINLPFEAMRGKLFFWEMDDLFDEITWTATGYRLKTKSDFTEARFCEIEDRFFANNDVKEACYQDVIDYYVDTLKRAFQEYTVKLNEIREAEIAMGNSPISLIRKFVADVSPKYTEDYLNLTVEPPINYSELPIGPADDYFVPIVDEQPDIHGYALSSNQIAYLLKYGYSYGYLYYCMYRDLFLHEAFRNPDFKANVLSVGCGTKVDLVGLKLARAKSGISNKVFYHGIDLNDWTTDHYCLYPEDGCFQQIEAAEYIGSTVLRSNVVIFPYSMNEIVAYDHEAWKDICCKLAQNLMGNRVYIMVNIRKNNKNSGFYQDVNSSDFLIQQMKENGYHVNSDRFFIKGQPVNYGRINNGRPFFTYLNGVLVDVDESTGGRFSYIENTVRGAEYIGNRFSDIASIKNYFRDLYDELNDRDLQVRVMGSVDFINYRIVEFVKSEG